MEDVLCPRGGGRSGAKAEEGRREANGGGGKDVDGKEKGCMNGDEGKYEEKGDGGVGGILTHLISIVSSPRGTPNGGEAAKRKGEFEVDDVGNGGFSSKAEEDGACGNENGGGGVFSKVSNFFNQSEGGGGGGENEVEKESEKVMKDIGNKRMKMEAEAEEGGVRGGGGIIDNLVSHLPTSIPDDAAPTTDEASILITSIVRD